MNYPDPNYQQTPPQTYNTAVLGSGDAVSVTIRAGSASDPVVIFKGSNNAEVASLIQGAEATGLFAIIGTATASLKGFFNAGQTLGAQPMESPQQAQAGWQAQQAPQAPQGGWQQPPQQQYQQSPPQAAQQPPGPAPQCPHGVKVYSPAGTNAKSGKAYGASWQCAITDWRDPNRCKPQWIDQRR